MATAASPSTPPTAASDQPARRDFRQEVTDQIVAMLEKGTAPWQKPWEPGVLQLPLNPTTGKVYRGGNALHLMAVAGRKGFEDPRWLTYRQAQEHGWQVRQGEKGTHIEFWQFPEHERNRDSGEKPNADSPGDETGREESRSRMLHRIYTVFNGKQIDGIPAYEPQKPQEWEAVQAGERILVNSGARITHDQDDRAFYSPASDKIHLPPREAFKNASDYYGTALHELSHWSGHQTRLNRETLNESYRFGDTNYAKEELRAELASVFLAAEKGIPHNPEQHAAYVASWIQTLKNDKNEIFRAAKDAHAAADYLIAFDKELPKDRSPQEPTRTETAELVAAREPAAGAASVSEKQTATESRLPVEAGPKRLAEESLAAAQDLTKRVFGDKAKHYLADTESGTYRGVIVAETAQHLVQRISPKSVAIHDKTLLPSSVAPGANVLVSYSNNVAQVRPYKARQRAQALAR
jgi:antirestriction protein ArdC